MADPPGPLALFAQRALAFAVDAIIAGFAVLLALFVAGPILAAVASTTALPYALASSIVTGGSLVLVVVAMLAIEVLMERSKGLSTPGNRAAGLVVTDTLGRPASVPRLAARAVLRPLSVFLIGGVLPAIAGAPALHDAISGTRVRPRAALGQASPGGHLGAAGATGYIAVVAVTTVLVALLLRWTALSIQDVFSNLITNLATG